jgi:hypothetical protein
MAVILHLNEDLIWQSDWSGDEVGFDDDVDVVGLYMLQLPHKELYFYIDMDTMKILDAWSSEEE